MNRRDICVALNVSAAGLEILCRKAAGKGGRTANGLQGMGYGAPMAAKPLEAGKYLERDAKGVFRITDAGRAIVARAREMGW